MSQKSFRQLFVRGGLPERRASIRHALMNVGMNRPFAEERDDGAIVRLFRCDDFDIEEIVVRDAEVEGKRSCSGWEPIR